jgi:hypothetical protein
MLSSVGEWIGRRLASCVRPPTGVTTSEQPPAESTTTELTRHEWVDSLTPARVSPARGVVTSTATRPAPA